MNKGINLLADYVFLSKYSQIKSDGCLESWGDTLNRIYAMHRVKLRELNLLDEETENYLRAAQEMELRKKLLSSQRGRQFASPNKNSGILKHEAKMYNCSGTYIDRVEVFGEVMYLLLCGCGVGYSLHKKYIEKLPCVPSDFTDDTSLFFLVPDSIEGWADAIKYVVSSLFQGRIPHCDYSKIRPEGSLIDGKFKAPGHKPLARAIRNIVGVFEHAKGRKLKSIEVHDILCFIAEAVVSGGVRRSAMIALFDKDDELMLKAKTGNWWEENPQRAMANNSIAVSINDTLSYGETMDAMEIVRQFGEPGFMQVPDYQYVANPCAEVLLHPSINNQTGFSFCNLVEINAEQIKDEAEFVYACTIAAFLATVQSLYTDFKYLSPTTRQIAERDRAIGVSITGLMANPMLKGKVLSKGAKMTALTNEHFAAKFGINPSRACTTVKPSGNASAILGLYCSGIHPAHSKKYLRRVRIKTNSPEYIALKGTPLVKDLRGDDAVISFPIEIDNQDVILKDQMSAVEHLKYIAMVKHYWVNKGTSSGQPSNNISATVEVKPHEWREVGAILYVNNHLYTGVSLLPSCGDQIYDNAPFQRISTPELEKEYNDALDYINTHDIDFNAIMSNRQAIFSGDLTAIGCSGGSCELK